MSQVQHEGDGAAQRFRGLVFLSVCLGAARFLVTGDSSRAALTTLVMVGLATALLVWARHRLESSVPVWVYYAAGTALLLAPSLGYRFGYDSPWDDLQARYGDFGPLPQGLPCSGDVVLVRRLDEIMVQRYPLRRVTCKFLDHGVGFVHSWPLSLVYGPIGIPLRDLTGCSERTMEFGYTRLEIAGLRIDLEVDDVDRRVLEWCRERELAGPPRAAEVNPPESPPRLRAAIAPSSRVPTRQRRMAGYTGRRPAGDF